MKKLQKRYVIFIFVLALAVGIIVRDFDTSKFAVVKNSEAYAPTQIPLYSPGDDGEGITQDGKININTASQSELMTLEGIGEGLAKRIIEYRLQNGRFEVIQDIMKVSGIGEKKFADIMDYIVVE